MAMGLMLLLYLKGTKMRFHSVLGHCMCSLLDDVSVLTGQMGLEYLRNVKRKAALKIIRSKPKL